MAKSKLIVRRKKSTVLVSTQTLQEAIRRANLVVESLMAANQNDPRINKVEGAVQHMGRVLNAQPQQMKQDGVSSISDYMDNAKSPAEATKLKQEVDMINQLHSEVREQHAQPATPPQEQSVGYVPDSAVMGSAKNADGGAAFSTDRNEQGEAKAPEKLEVPRVAKKKKEAVPEEPIAAPVPEAAAPVPTPAPAAGGKVNPIDYIPTEALIKVIEGMPKEEDFAQNKGKQDALIELTNVLKTRPVLPPEPVEGAAPAAPASTAPGMAAPAADAPAVPAPVAASAKKRADLGDHAMGQGDTISNGSGASSSVGNGGATSHPTQVSTDSGISKSPEPKTDFGGLSLSSALEDEKTADDYRVQDYKITEEGVRPSGGLPTMDEQESGSHSTQFTEQEQGMGGFSASVQAAIKQGKTPPGISEELMHKLKKEYPGDKSKAYATAWSIHNQKESSLKIIAAEMEKIASAGGNGGWSTSYKPMEVDEDGGRTPEIAEAHAGLEDHTGISHPETTMPIKLNEQQSLKASAKTAADLSTSKAVKESEQIGNDLKKMYLDAKSLTQVNDTRPVREAVEAIFRAADMFDEATKTLNKQDQQEKSEAEAAEIKAKNKKSTAGLSLAAAAE